MRVFVVALAVALCAPAVLSSPDAGELDLSFDSWTAVGTNCCSLRGVRALLRQADGKLIAGGYFSTNSGAANRILRLNQDGTVDLTFDTGFGANNDIYALAAAPNGGFI